MDTRTFDRSGEPVSRLQQGPWTLLGVFQVINGFLALDRGDPVLGSVMVALGVVFVPVALLAPRLNRFTIALDESHLKIRKGSFVRHLIPWAAIPRSG
jgi:hypothetical protein